MINESTINEFPAITSQEELDAVLEETGDLIGDNIFPLTAARIIFFENGKPIISGTSENDLLTGTDADENITGVNGDDTLFGNGGDDEFYDGLGNDLVDGGAGNDVFINGEGNDTIYGGDGDDTIVMRSFSPEESQLAVGGSGNDLIFVNGDGNDTIYGEAGNDALSSGNGSDTVSGGEGNDLIDGGPISDVPAEDQGDLLSGDGGDDFIFGGRGEDTIYGGDGNDTLVGASSGNANPDTKEVLDIYSSDDPLSDYLTGGSGADSFIIGVAGDSFYDNAGDSDLAIITDFSSTEDKIELTGVADDYILESQYYGTFITLDRDNNDVFSDGDERIALVQNNSNLDIGSEDFNFV